MQFLKLLNLKYAAVWSKTEYSLWTGLYATHSTANYRYLAFERLPTC